MRIFKTIGVARFARPGRGRSGGYRMIVAYRVRGRAVFLFGFAKNERDNISPEELMDLRRIGADWLAAKAETIAEALDDGELQEIDDDDESA